MSIPSLADDKLLAPTFLEYPLWNRGHWNFINHSCLDIIQLSICTLKSLEFVTYDMFSSALVGFVYLFCFMLNQQCRAGWVMGGRGFLINSPGTASCLLLACLLLLPFASSKCYGIPKKHCQIHFHFLQWPFPQSQKWDFQCRQPIDNLNRLNYLQLEGKMASKNNFGQSKMVFSPPQKVFFSQNPVIDRFQNFGF